MLANAQAGGRSHNAAEHINTSHTLTVHKPRVGLLSNGAESQKGSLLVQEAHVLLTQATHLNFVGNVEPAAIFNGDVDIVVCDGFAGNILLKTLEAVTVLCNQRAQQQCAHTQHNFFDWREVGGAHLIGVKGTVVVAHGCTMHMQLSGL